MTSAEEYFNKAEFFRNENKLKEAIECYSKAIDLYIFNITDKTIYFKLLVSYMYRGDSYLALNDCKSAIQDYTFIINFINEPNIILYDAYYKRIGCYLQLNNLLNAFLDCEFILINQETFSPFISYDTLSILQEMYTNLSENLCQEYISVALDYIFQEHDVCKGYIEFYKAYIINSELAQESLSNAVEKSFHNTQIVALCKFLMLSCLKIEEATQGMQMQNKIQFAEDWTKEYISKYLKNSFNHTDLQINPTQVRKLDL